MNTAYNYVLSILGDKFGQLLSATTTDVFSRWNLKKVHSAGITGKGMVIAILDKGINLDHQSMKGKYDCKKIHGDKSAKVTATDRQHPTTMKQSMEQLWLQSLPGKMYTMEQNCKFAVE